MTDAEFWAYLPLHGLQPEWFASLSENELLRCLVCGEAEGEPYLGQLGDVWVVLNRVRDPGWWGSTIAQCVFWPAQFSSFWADRQLRLPAMREEVWTPTRQIEAAVWEATRDDANGFLGRDPTGGSLYFYNPKNADPPWKYRVSSGFIQIGNQRFCCE